jgi:hypothetical protein
MESGIIIMENTTPKIPTIAPAIVNNNVRIESSSLRYSHAMSLLDLEESMWSSVLVKSQTTIAKAIITKGTNQ